MRGAVLPLDPHAPLRVRLTVWEKEKATTRSSAHMPLAVGVAVMVVTLAMTQWACGGQPQPSSSPPGSPPSATDESYAVLHSFNGDDGQFPSAGVVLDLSGNLYGTTDQGGGAPCGLRPPASCGVVFKLAPDGTYTVLHRFTEMAGCDVLGGIGCEAAVILGSGGNLYGTTINGGASDLGAIFKLGPGGTYTILHSFNGDDGNGPDSGVLLDAVGNLYGTTPAGGASWGTGVVFKLTPDGTFTVLHRFSGGADGAAPSGGLVLDSRGNLYGTTTTSAGSESNECLLFKLATNGAYTVLHSFGGEVAGSFPSVSGLVRDDAGNLYGTTAGGNAPASGVAFRIAPDGAYTALHTFGDEPLGALVLDSAGNLYGTTFSGGATGNGAVFKLSPDGSLTVLHSFSGSDGANPKSPLVFDSAGNLYGTTWHGGPAWVSGIAGSGDGVVFKLASGQ
jgi:uncharacterized repeat protein (TIGR03803 family)